MAQTVHYLSLKEFAQRIGLQQGTLSSYHAQGRLPEPDAIIGSGPRATRGWLAETVDEWQANRPGQGARTDLKR